MTMWPVGRVKWRVCLGWRAALPALVFGFATRVALAQEAIPASTAAPGQDGPPLPPDAPALLPHDLSPWGMLMAADRLVKSVMFGLALASVVTWTIWLVTKLELAAARGTGMLATIGATAPFVGLFGTVWGIMNAFIGISRTQTTNLAVVAPGIAEALLATAIIVAFELAPAPLAPTAAPEPEVEGERPQRSIAITFNLR